MGRRRGSGEELARARSGKEKGRQEGRQEGVEWGAGDRIGTIGRRLGGGNGEGQRDGGDGRGRRGGGEEGARGGGILQMDMIQAHGMPGWNEVIEFSN